jgi:hypothetical protein
MGSRGARGSQEVPGSGAAPRMGTCPRHVDLYAESMSGVGEFGGAADARDRDRDHDHGDGDEQAIEADAHAHRVAATRAAMESDVEDETSNADLAAQGVRRQSTQVARWNFTS